MVEPVPQASDRRGVDAGLVAHLAGGSRRKRAAEHRDAAALPSLTCAIERERLACARRGADHLHAVAAARQRIHEPALLVAERRPRPERRFDGVLAGEARRPFAPGARAVEQLALDPQQTAGRVARLASFGLELDDVLARQERRAVSLDNANLGAVARGLGKGLHDVAAGERRSLASEPVRALERASAPLEPVAVERPVRGAAEHPPDVAAVKTVLRGARSPLGTQPVDRDAVVLAPARLERRHLRRAGRPLPTLGRVRSRISARRREKCSITPRGTPTTSAVPRSTGCHRTRSCLLSSARNTAWYR